MTKHETNQIINAVKYINAGMTDTAARSVSALYRSARTEKSKDQILSFAIAYSLLSNPEFLA